MMDKQSSEKVAQVLRDAQTTLLAQDAELQQLRSKVAAYQRREEATKVASMLHEKGCELDTDFPELVERLEKEAAAGRLPEIARAADMIGPNMSIGITNQNNMEGVGVSNFEAYLMGNVG